MIENNLRIIMAERHLRPTDLAKATGISRNTITSLKFNKPKGIRLDTLNKLCEYLEITPKEFFKYDPKK